MKLDEETSKMLKKAHENTVRRLKAIARKATAVERRIRTDPVMKLFRVDEIPEYKGVDWEISKFSIRRHDIETLRAMFIGRPIPPGDYTRLHYRVPEGHQDWSCTRNYAVMMSDTPAEMLDAYEFVTKAHHNVLVAGLGLGCVIKPLMANKRVEHVTVMEQSEELIKAVGPHYNRFGAKLRIIHTDAFTWKADRKFQCAWFDIWLHMSGDNLPEMKKLKEKYKARYTRCWSEDWLKQQAKKKPWEL